MHWHFSLFLFLNCRPLFHLFPFILLGVLWLGLVLQRCIAIADDPAARCHNGSSCLLYVPLFVCFSPFPSLCISLPNHTLRTLECVRALSQQPWTCSNASFGGVAMLVRTGGGAKCFLPHTHRLPSLPSLSLLLSSSKSDMQSGFALLEAGSLGGTTVVNILFKNFADTLVRCCVLKTSTWLHCNKNIFF